MKARVIISALRAFRRREDGATLVEFALVVPLFLLLAFGLLDFGRLGFSYVMAQKATERAVREVVVRTPVCTGLPEFNTRGGTSTALDEIRYGASCQSNSLLCADPGTVTCTAADGSATGSEIFVQIQTLLPTNALPQNLHFTYAFDENLGFLGGPYTPLVTVELRDLDFEFVTPIGALANLLSANDSGEIGQSFGFPSMSTSLPGEVLLDGGTS